MKKIILPICAVCFAFITSCSKDVKVPSTQTKNTSVTKTTTSPSQTSNDNQSDHHCGNNSSHNSNNGY
jgi:hypothetical protein